MADPGTQTQEASAAPAPALPTASNLFPDAPEGEAPAALPQASQLFPDAPQPAAPLMGRQMPAALRERIAQSDVITRTIQGGIKGFEQGYGEAPTGQDTMDALRYYGIVPRGPNDSGPLGLRFFNQALIAPLAAAGEGFFRAMSALPAAVGESAGAAAEATGTPAPEAAAVAEHAGGAAQWLMTSPEMVGLQMTRAVPDGNGGFRDERVGSLPANDAELEAQSQAAANAIHLPDAAERITRLYNEGGMLPAEVVHDAANDPELGRYLAGGPEPPGIFKGEPGAVTSLPNVAPEDFARLADEAQLNERHSAVTAQLAALPEGDASAADRLNRLQAVEGQLADPDLMPGARKALMERRDQILVDTNPEALQAAAAPIEARRVLEAQQASIEARLGELDTGRETGQPLHENALQASETAGNVPHDERLQPLPAGTQQGQPVPALSDLPRSIYEGLAPGAPAVARAEAQAALSGRVAEARQSGASEEGIVQQLRQSPIANASPELQRALERDLALPPLSLESPHGAMAGTGEGEGGAPAVEAKAGTPGAGRVAPTALRPIESEVEPKTLALSESTEEAAGRSLGELPQTGTAKNVEQEASVRQVFDTDPDRANAIALGQREPPKNILRTAFYVEAAKRAQASGDLEMTRRLAGSVPDSGMMPGMAKRFGQEIQYLSNMSPDAAVTKIREVEDALVEQAGGTEAVAEKAAQVKELLPEASKVLLPKELRTWNNFLASLAC